MKTSQYLKTMLLVLISTFTLAVNAATLDTSTGINYNANGFKGTISEVFNISDFMPGATQGYYVPKPNPTAMSAAHVQTALNAAGASFVVGDFFKIEGSINNLNTSSLGLSFSGFLVKYGTTTLIGLFSSPISSLDFLTHNGKDVSHIAYFNTSVSQVPVPAALWLFAPALLGLMGFRRRLIK